MFDSEKTFARWRQQLEAAGITSQEILDELEGHLRDEFERQVGTGVAPEKAWEGAIAGMGDARGLRAEFAKISQGTRGWKKVLHAFYFGSIIFMVLVNTWTLFDYETTLFKKSTGIFIICVIASYLGWLPHWLRSAARHQRAAIGKGIELAASLVWLWPAWQLLHVAHILQAEPGMIVAMLLLCLTAAIGLSAVAYVLNEQDPRSGDGNPPWPLRWLAKPIQPVGPTLPDITCSLARLGGVEPLVQQSFDGARLEAERLGHGYIGTEHLLLGLLKLKEGGFTDLLRRMNLDEETVRAEVDQMVSPQTGQARTAGIPLTPRAQKAIAVAAREAKARNRAGVGCEHVLLGLFIEGSGVAAKVLRKVGISLERLRKEVSREH